MLSYVWIFDDCSVCGRHILEAIVLDRESIDYTVYIMMTEL